MAVFNPNTPSVTVKVPVPQPVQPKPQTPAPAPQPTARPEQANGFRQVTSDRPHTLIFPWGGD